MKHPDPKEISKKVDLQISIRLILSRLIATILLIGGILSYFNLYPDFPIGAILLIIGFSLGFFYGMIINKIVLIERLLIIALSLFPLLKYISIILFWDSVFIFHIFLIIPISAFIYYSFGMTGKLKYEYPFLLIMALLASIMFLGG